MTTLDAVAPPNVANNYPSIVSTLWGATVSLSAFASLMDVENELRSTGVLDAKGFGYARDHHFDDYVLTGIKTQEDVDEFLRTLDDAAKRYGRSGCSKAFVIRHWLAGDFCSWMNDPARQARVAIARNRRVNCGCHENGSFADREAAQNQKNAHQIMVREIYEAKKASA